MAVKARKYVTKTEICRLFSWSRYEFDANARAGMPVKAAAAGRNGQWLLDPRAIRRWAAKRAEEKAARERAWAEKRQRERKALDEFIWRKKEAKERAEREARQRREQEWRREDEQRKAEKLLDTCYSHCRRCAYRDIGSPFGRNWSTETPHWLDDWPHTRPSWWAPPPGLMEAIMAEPDNKPYGYQEPNWHEWIPKYVPGRPWPYRRS